MNSAHARRAAVRLELPVGQPSLPPKGQFRFAAINLPVPVSPGGYSPSCMYALHEAACVFDDHVGGYKQLVRPRQAKALAALRLSTSSNLVSRSTGSSAALAPLLVV